MANELMMELEDVQVGERLAGDISLIEVKADQVMITNQQSLDLAMDFLKQVKAMHKRVEETFKPMKDAAKKAVDAVRAREKEMLVPLEAAEKAVKAKITDYQLELDRIRVQMEEEAKRVAAEAARQSLNEAAEAESNGDMDAAEMALAEAEMAEETALHMSVAPVKATSSGLTMQKDYEIVSIDETKLPLYVDGVKMWKTPWEANIKRLIKMKGGLVTIPGVVFKETYTSKVRI